LAYLMADMEDIPALLQTRLMEALTHPENALAAAVGMTGMLLKPGPAGEPPVMGDGDVSEYFHRWVLPAAMPFFEPITVMDPACGSGVMLLASAATVPHWARRYGFVQFFGQDIMHIAVQMAKAQVRAYGLNGFEVQMMTGIGDVGWEKYRVKLQASAEYHAALEAEEALAAAPHAPGPALTVIPREVTGHVAHPTLRRRAAEQAAPTFSLKRPTPEEAARLLASRPRPTTSRGVRP
ncbi:MAG: N-6 DNA methylase, partial [Chloroflexales bacterium]